MNLIFESLKPLKIPSTQVEILKKNTCLSLLSYGFVSNAPSQGPWMVLKNIGTTSDCQGSALITDCARKVSTCQHKLGTYWGHACQNCYLPRITQNWLSAACDHKQQRWSSEMSTTELAAVLCLLEGRHKKSSLVVKSLFYEVKNGLMNSWKVPKYPCLKQGKYIQFKNILQPKPFQIFTFNHGLGSFVLFCFYLLNVRPFKTWTKGLSFSKTYHLSRN